jgi:hypothetical protein
MDKTAIKIKQTWPKLVDSLNRKKPEHRDSFTDMHLGLFAEEAMQEKLKLARDKGRGGWWSTDCDTAHLKQLLTEHVEKGDMRDVMNLAAMIYFRESAEIESLKD